ncbi:MAG: hypothetical protein HY445_01650 [Candidatus Niyogibacteria bacterium]|nr:hypothetical protein [Candidatus Niyogibacteria bacterium]
MNTETAIGYIAGFIVIASVIPYAIRVLQRKIKPNLVSWSVWSIIGFAILLTFRSSGATSNIWPAVFGFFNPAFITVLALWRGMRIKPKWWEIACGAMGVASIIWWGFVYGDALKAQFALYLAIIADTCAAIPTIGFLWRNPHEDRPFAWSLFGIGYGLAIFAITDHTFANSALHIYMFIFSNIIAGILAAYRVRNRLPISEWI